MAEESILAVDPADAAKRLGIGKTSLYMLISSGELPSFRIASRRLISVRAIEEFVARREKAETSARAA